MDKSSQEASGFNGVNNYNKNFTSDNCNVNKRSQDNFPVPHNLEAYDSGMHNYILNNVTFGSPFLTNAAGDTITAANVSLAGSIILPSNINGVTVTALSVGAFYGNKYLTSVMVPDTVTSIGFNAFKGCIALTRITLPFVGNTLNGIYNTHFGYIFGAESYGLQNSNIPSSLKTVTITGGNSIASCAFYSCYSLTSITILTGVTSIGENAFSYCTSLANITMSSSIKSIGNYAFLNCAFLTNITIPSSVRHVGNYAFYSCSSLSYIEIQYGVVSIGDYAFYYCNSLTNIAIPSNVTSIGFNAFGNCNALTNITVPFVGSNLNEATNAHFGYIFGAINYNSQIGIIPSSLKTVVITGGNNIPSYAFDGCTLITSIVIPFGVTSIGTNAFYSCTSLEDIIIPSRVGMVYSYQEKAGNSFAD